MDDYDVYNGTAEHDMWVDYSYHENTGELDEYFDDEEDSYEEDY